MKTSEPQRSSSFLLVFRNSRTPAKKHLTRFEGRDIVQCMQRGVAQLVARLLWEQEVRGSNPRIPTMRE